MNKLELTGKEYSHKISLELPEFHSSELVQPRRFISQKSLHHGMNKSSLTLKDDKDNLVSVYNHSENVNLVSIKTKIKNKTRQADKEKEIITNDISRICSHNSTYLNNLTKDEVFLNLISLVPKEVDNERIREFFISPLPRGKTMMCQIKTVYNTRFERFYPKFHLYLNPNKKILMTAHKKFKAASSTYEIFQANNDYNIISEEYIGKIVSNFTRNTFSIYDKGKKYTDTHDASEYRQQYGHVIFPFNLVKSGPRTMKVLLPNINEMDEITVIKPSNEKESIQELYIQSRNSNIIMELHSKKPNWSQTHQSYILNFNGRVESASSKNFQLVDKEDEVILQFGKIIEELFALDFKYPLSPFQAFCICLMSIDKN